MGERTLVNIIGGFLGVGKTTAINHLLQQRPAHEKWAVVVNEFGDIGIDGSLLRGAASLDDDVPLGNDVSLGAGSSVGGAAPTPKGAVLHEIPGGCICCTAGFAFQDAVVRLLRRERPHRLLIEPTGIATLRSIIDTLRQPGLAEAVELRTILTLVDPAHWVSARHRTNETYRDQIEAADVLLANRGDLSESGATEQFLRDAGELFPPKRHVAVVAYGQVDVALLDKVRDSPSEVPAENGAVSHGDGQVHA
ncbi:MAG: GTP-binding protein, partial [Alkalispirochaeta sp.]